MTEPLCLSAHGIRLGFTPDCGRVTGLQIEDGGAIIAPLHQAGWSEADVPADAPRHQRGLAGDFIAAPFGPGPMGLHGAANGLWQILQHETHLLRAVMQGDIQGASLIKELSLTAGHPFLYQRHLFIGGAGQLPLANHAMVSLPGGGKLSFSRKRWFETFDTALETDPARGRSRLAYPRRSEDPNAFPAADGGSVDLQRYPWGEAHEDFVSAIEEPTSQLGWTAVVRPDSKDLFLSLRNPKQLPMTMLWHSNGGRDYAPWNGQHRHCLGIEEGAALPVLGLSAQETPDPLSAAGQPPLVTLAPEGVVDIRHIIGALHWPSGQMVAGVAIEGDVLTITGDWGAERKVPIRGSWLFGPTATAATAQPRSKALDWDL